MPLHLTKVAFGCDDVDILRARLEGHAIAGETAITTRYAPTRAAELAGGSLFWILRHQLVARSAILDFGEADGRCVIRLDARLVPVRPQPKRAHQGWRYLADADAPADLDGAVDDLAALPPGLVSTLAGLGLV